MKKILGRIARLYGKPLEDGFEIEYGLENNKGNYYNFSFAEISFGNINPCVSKTYICGGYTVKEKKFGIKEFVIFNGDLKANENETMLFVIIPYATRIVSNSKKIAGIYSTEAILEMHEGDIVELSKGVGFETYMAVRAGNELLLVKKTR